MRTRCCLFVGLLILIGCQREASKPVAKGSPRSGRAEATSGSKTATAIQAQPVSNETVAPSSPPEVLPGKVEAHPENNVTSPSPVRDQRESVPAAGSDDVPPDDVAKTSIESENIADSSEDVLEQAQELNSSETAKPEFRSGEATATKLERDAILRNGTGFTIQMPSHAPIPSPTVYRGKLYVSGGFSSHEYYCFDARTGKFIWGAELDDDGPSSAVPYEDSIIFSCESCTIFALDAGTGEMRWSHWLGDPLMSMPTIANGKVFAVYPGEREASDDESTGDEPSTTAAGKDQHALDATHQLVCMDAQTGDVVWQRWLDSDCLSAPIAAGDDICVATFPGTVYRFRQSDGEIKLARRMRATSAPVIVGDDIYFTRRSDLPDDTQVAECIARHRGATLSPIFLAANRPAPYLDREIQMHSDAAAAAGAAEAPNGIGGGFGGGFFMVEDGASDDSKASGAAAQESDDAEEAETEVSDDADDPVEMPTGDAAVTKDKLAQTQSKAADNVGLGNVSTLQGFQGSRLLHWHQLTYNCMGDSIVCASATDGKELWSTTLKGDLEKSGGHLAAPPVMAGNRLFVTTLAGEIREIDPQHGETLMSWTVGSEVRFPATIDNGRIYVGCQDGKLVCIDTGDRDLTGWPMWGGNPAHNSVVMDPAEPGSVGNSDR